MWDLIKKYWSVLCSILASTTVAWLLNFDLAGMDRTTSFISMSLMFYAVFTVIKIRRKDKPRKTFIEKIATSQRQVKVLENVLNPNKPVEELISLIDQTRKKLSKMEKLKNFLKALWGNKFTLLNTIVVLFIASLTQVLSTDEITAGLNDSYNWVNNTYKTITITDTSSLTNREEFTTFLTANATKQDSSGGRGTQLYQHHVCVEFPEIVGSNDVFNLYFIDTHSQYTSIDDLVNNTVEKICNGYLVSINPHSLMLFYSIKKSSNNLNIILSRVVATSGQADNLELPVALATNFTDTATIL